MQTRISQARLSPDRSGREAAEHGAAPRLEEIEEFGSNPGNLRMFAYQQRSIEAHPALMVVLHGCGQTAESYDHGAGWSTLADRYGFTLLLPQQQPFNNPKGCFNWFQTADTESGRGEALSIYQMIEKLVTDKRIDRNRVFIAGMSAGGAMTSAMLACYPAVFAGGAMIAGLPYGAFTTLRQAFEGMFQSPARSAREWGNLVRKSAPQFLGPWPRISVWQGGADRMVIPSNAREVLKQWTDVHGLPLSPIKQVTTDGYPREVWLNEAGDEVIESFTITSMAHGTPLATGNAYNECGVASPSFLDVGISSSYHIAKFFGLTNANHRREVAKSCRAQRDRHPPGNIDRPNVSGPGSGPTRAVQLPPSQAGS